MTRLMSDPQFQQEQWDNRYADHVAPINRYVDELRASEHGWAPYVAPVHGGAEACVLSILRDPGPGTHDGAGSGFLCVENDDPSAETQCELLRQAGLTAGDLTPWNAFPWYIIRAPSRRELAAGVPTVVRMIELMPELRVVLLQGGDAQKAWRLLIGQHRALTRCRQLIVISTYHPGRQALFHPDPAERTRRVESRAEAFRRVADVLAQPR